MENEYLTRKQISWINSRTEDFNDILKTIGQGSTFRELQSLLDSCKENAQVSTKSLVGVIAKILHFFENKLSVENKAFILGTDVPEKNEGLIKALEIANQVAAYRSSLSKQAEKVAISHLTSHETGDGAVGAAAQAAAGGRTI